MQPLRAFDFWPDRELILPDHPERLDFKMRNPLSLSLRLSQGENRIYFWKIP